MTKHIFDHPVLVAARAEVERLGLDMYALVAANPETEEQRAAVEYFAELPIEDQNRVREYLTICAALGD